MPINHAGDGALQLRPIAHPCTLQRLGCAGRHLGASGRLRAKIRVHAGQPGPAEARDHQISINRDSPAPSQTLEQGCEGIGRLTDSSLNGCRRHWRRAKAWAVGLAAHLEASENMAARLGGEVQGLQTGLSEGPAARLRGKISDKNANPRYSTLPV